MNELRQIQTLIRLKWKLTLRASARDTLVIIQSIIFNFFILLFAIAVGIIVIVAFDFVRHELWEIPGIEVMTLANLLWFIYGVWILVPLFGFRLNESYDISKLIPLPVKPKTLFIAGIAGNFVDIAVTIPIAAMIGIMILFTTGSDTFAFNLLVLAIYLLNMILAAQLLIILLYNILPRISLYKIILSLAAIIALTCYFWFSWQARTVRVISIFDIEVGQKIFIYFPHGMASSAIFHGYHGVWNLAFRGLGWLLLHTAALGVVTGVLYAKWYATGHIEGTPVASEEGGRRSYAELMASFWTKMLRPILPPAALEMMRKDHLNLLRSRNFLLYKNLPVILGPGIVIIATWHSTTHYIGIQNVSHIVGCLIGSSLIFSFFIITSQANLFSGNIFGLEGKAIYHVFTTQVEKRHIIMGKNAFILSLLMFDALLFGALAWLVLGSQIPGAPAVGFGVFIALLYLFILLVALGNFVSALFPYYHDLERPAVTAQHVILLMLVEAVTVAIACVILLPAFYLLYMPLQLGSLWLWFPFIPTGIAYCFFWLWLSIRYAAPLTERLERSIIRKVSDL